MSTCKETKILNRNMIRRDEDAQVRTELNPYTVRNYAELMNEEGFSFPPLIVFWDGDTYWLADGFHRLRAAERVELLEIKCEVYHGDAEDAKWYALTANLKHGLPLSANDKERMIKLALRHASGQSMSNNELSRHLQVAAKTVKKYRDELAAVGEIPQLERRVGKDGKSYQATRTKASHIKPTAGPSLGLAKAEQDGESAEPTSAVGESQPSVAHHEPLQSVPSGSSDVSSTACEPTAMERLTADPDKLQAACQAATKPLRQFFERICDEVGLASPPALIDDLMQQLGAEADRIAKARRPFDGCAAQVAHAAAA